MWRRRKVEEVEEEGSGGGRGGGGGGARRSFGTSIAFSTSREGARVEAKDNHKKRTAHGTKYVRCGSTDDARGVQEGHAHGKTPPYKCRNSGDTAHNGRAALQGYGEVVLKEGVHALTTATTAMPGTSRAPRIMETSICFRLRKFAQRMLDNPCEGARWPPARIGRFCVCRSVGRVHRPGIGMGAVYGTPSQGYRRDRCSSDGLTTDVPVARR